MPVQRLFHGLVVATAAAAAAVHGFTSNSGAWTVSRARCADRPGFYDTQGNSCGTYKGSDWCTPTGERGIGWDSTWGTLESRGVSDVSAVDACCACGGGLRWTRSVEDTLLDVIDTVEETLPMPQALEHTNHSVDHGVIFDSGTYTPNDESAFARITGWGGTAAVGGGNMLLSSLCPDFTSHVIGSHLRPYTDNFASVETPCFGVNSSGNGALGAYRMDRGAATFTVVATNAGPEAIAVTVTGGIQRGFFQRMIATEHTFDYGGARAYVKTVCKERVIPMADPGSISHLWIYDPVASPGATHTFPADASSDNNTFAGLSPGAELVYMVYTSSRCIDVDEHRAIFVKARPLLLSVPIHFDPTVRTHARTTAAPTAKPHKSAEEIVRARHDAGHHHHTTVAQHAAAGTVLVGAVALCVVVLRKVRALRVRRMRDFETLHSIELGEIVEDEMDWATQEESMEIGKAIGVVSPRRLTTAWHGSPVRLATTV